jgi:hypothetical protein
VVTVFREGGEVRQKRLEAWHRMLRYHSGFRLRALSTVATARSGGSVNNRIGARGDLARALGHLEAELLSQVLRAGGNRTQPAKRLSIHRQLSKMQNTALKLLGCLQIGRSMS